MLTFLYKDGYGSGLCMNRTIGEVAQDLGCRDLIVGRSIQWWDRDWADWLLVTPVILLTGNEWYHAGTAFSFNSRTGYPGRPHSIELHPKLFVAGREEALDHIFKHEIAHLLAGVTRHHDDEWERAMIGLGIEHPVINHNYDFRTWGMT